MTDLFCGQFKSTITCPDCNNINITFDPFDTINLPLLTQVKRRGYYSSENVEEFKFFYVPKSVVRNPICLKINNINNDEELSNVIERIKKEESFFYHDKINADNLLMVDILRKEKYGYADKKQIVRQFVYDEEFIFSFDFNRGKDTVLLPVFFYDKELEKENKSGYPRMVICQKDQTLNDIKKKIYFYLRKYILSPFLKENEEKDELSMELEKYMLDKNYELPDDIIYEKIEEEFNKVFKKYNENEDEEKSEDNEKKEDDDDKDKEDKSDEDKNKDDDDKDKEDKSDEDKNKDEDEERNNEEEKEKNDEEKLDENQDNEEEKNNKEDANDKKLDEKEENKDKEVNDENNEKKEGEQNPVEEKKENEQNQNNEDNNKKEEGEKMEDKEKIGRISQEINRR